MESPFFNLTDRPFKFLHRPTTTTLFHPNSLVLLAGAPKIGKTTIALALANSIVNGIPFAGIPLPQCTVGFVSLDDSPKEIVAACHAQPGLTENNNFFLNITNEYIDQPKGLEQLEIFMSRYPSCVVFIDSLHAAISKAQTRDARSVRRLLLPLRRIAERSGTIFLLHHTDRYGKQIADHTQIQAAVSQCIVHQAVNHQLAAHTNGLTCRHITWHIAGRDLGAPRKLHFLSDHPTSYKPYDPNPIHHITLRDTSTQPIINVIRHTPKSCKQIAHETGLTYRLVCKRINKLLERGSIMRITKDAHQNQFLANF
jgi:RecA-family ATPase